MSPLTLEAPPALRRAWGEEVADVFIVWLDGVLSERAVPRDEHRQIISRLGVLEHDVTDVKTDLRGLRQEMNERFDRVNGRFDRMNERFDEMNVRMEKRFDEMNARMEKRFDEMNARFDGRFDEMNARFEGRLDKMNTRFDGRFDEIQHQMLVQTRWLIGSLALIGTVISVLLAIAQFAP